MLKKWISQTLLPMLRQIKFFPALSDAHNVGYKLIFLKNVFIFAAIASFVMGIARWNERPFLGMIDVLFACLAFLLMALLQRYPQKTEHIATIALWLCLVQFLTVFFVATDNTTRSGLLLLILASAFYLKGRYAGYYTLGLLFILVIGNHLIGIQSTGYTNLDMVSLCFYLIAQFFIIHNYESLREAQNSHLEALIQQRTEQLAAANQALEIEKQNLKRLSSTDHLTGLSNRHHFETLFAERQPAIRRRTVDAMILIDVDHFKKINDQHGHVSGDAVLKAIAANLKQHTRKSDIVVRWGGDELMIYAPRTNLQQATKLADKIRKHISTLRIGKVEYITISAGVAVLQPSDSLSLLLQRADKALYAAKQAGRNCTYPRPSEWVS